MDSPAVGEVASSQEEDGPPLRVLVAKIGMDGHDRGARVVARALRDGGMEVIYTGRHVRNEAVVQAAIEEDVDVLGVSILSGAHVPLLRELYRVIDATGSREVFDVVVGGTGRRAGVPHRRDRRRSDRGE